MVRVVDLELLRQVTRDAMYVYEAVQQAQAMRKEGQQALAAAEHLLKETGLAFLLEATVIVDTRDKVSREKLIQEYVTIQKSYADLKDALYRLGQVQLDAHAWDEALITLRALSKIEPDYRDVKSLWSTKRLVYLNDFLNFHPETSASHPEFGKAVLNAVYRLGAEEPRILQCWQLASLRERTSKYLVSGFQGYLDLIFESIGQVRGELHRILATESL